MKIEVNRKENVFHPDASRVIARFFSNGDKRAINTISAICGMSNQEASLALSQVLRDYSMRHRNISKIFEDEYEVYEEEEDIEAPEDVNKLLLTKIARNQAELIKLKTPVWLATILLGILLLTIWL